ncbi:MAG: DNA alkylation repair protein [Thermanaerothrix sp.]|nr:DNA alkylation repair protein [Thermanaerothrix sp.]
MPAVPLHTLHQRLQELSSIFEDVPQFKRGLKRLLDQYTDQSYRPGETIPLALASERLSVPPVVIHEVEAALHTLALQHPEAALQLANLLWTEGNSLDGYLAAVLIRAVPITDETRLSIQDHLTRWVQGTEKSPHLISTLVLATEGMKKAAWDSWQDLIRGWLFSPSPVAQRVALRAISSLVQDPNFEVLPFIFDWLTQWLQENPPTVLPQEVSDLLQALAERSPAETTYFLRQLMRLLPPSSARRLIRIALPILPEDYRQRLQSALRQLVLTQKPPPSGQPLV